MQIERHAGPTLVIFYWALYIEMALTLNGLQM